MGSKGFTIIELLVTVTVVAILVVALGFQYQGWQGGYRIESQTKDMYIDLMNTRALAMQTNRAHFMVLTANDYQIFEDNTGAGTVGSYDAGIDAAVRNFANPKPLEFVASAGVGTFTFDSRGLVSPNTSIRFNIGQNTPDYDCIVVFSTRINMGQWQGGACAAK